MSSSSISISGRVARARATSSRFLPGQSKIAGTHIFHPANLQNSKPPGLFADLLPGYSAGATEGGRQQNMFQNRHIAEDFNRLEGPRDPKPADLIGFQMRNPLFIEFDIATPGS
jgi:hypothetical protein